jgi:hypothetical protein
MRAGEREVCTAFGGEISSTTHVRLTVGGERDLAGGHKDHLLIAVFRKVGGGGHSLDDVVQYTNATVGQSRG